MFSNKNNTVIDHFNLKVHVFQGISYSQTQSDVIAPIQLEGQN